MRIAAIDIGTNSIHLMVADVDASGTVDVVHTSRDQTELGTGGLDRETLAPDAFERGVSVLMTFREACDSFNVEHIACTATSAVREAKNGKEFCDAVKVRTGIHVRVIAGVEEARLIWLGVRRDLDFSRGRVLIFDVGGGSTEFILCDAENILASRSLRLGHIRLAEGCHHSDPMTEAEQTKMRKVIRKRMKSLTRQVAPDDLGTIVGTSGTVRALARMQAMASGDDYPEHQHGMILTRDGVDQLVSTLSAATADERSVLPGMDARRVRTLPSGAVLVQEVLSAFDKPQLVTSNRSLRNGLIVDWIVKNKPELTLSRQLADPRSRSVRAMMERYGADPDHADAVAHTAQALFDATGPVHHLRIDDRRLLTFAAHLHDVGHHIDGRRHDRHGAYLIRHTHMPGFTAPEVAVLEQVVRYHNSKSPQKHHGPFVALSKADRKRVRILSSLLALADAFDRGHHQNLSHVDVQLAKRKLTIHATTQQSPDLERWATHRRKRRVENALDIEVDIVFSGPHGAAVAERSEEDETVHVQKP